MPGTRDMETMRDGDTAVNRTIKAIAFRCSEQADIALTTTPVKWQPIPRRGNEKTQSTDGALVAAPSPQQGLVKL